MLIVLGMLSLFTVLVISFVVFSSQMSESSFSSQQRRQQELSATPPIESAVLQLLVGTEDHRSAAFGASLLEDYYGVDGLEMRVAHRLSQPSPPTNALPVPPRARGQLLLPLNGQQEPQSTLFKFPTNWARWHYPNPNISGQPINVAPAPGNVTPVTTAFRNRLHMDLDDALTGRIVTFDEGPLKNRPFRIVRSFGTDNGTPDQGVTIGDNAEYSMAGNLVIDLSEFGDEVITIDGVSERLFVVAQNSPNRLLYSPGPDGQPGRAGVDDDGVNGQDDTGELGFPNTDDYGFRFVVNGQIFNGAGLNPAGVTGLARNGAVIEPAAHIEFTLNSRLTGADYQGGNGTDFAYPQLDEAWDAADMENIFLAWQPSDHRRVDTNSASFVPIYTGPNAAELNRQLGQNIIPSFHRPSIINYLMNAPIRLPTEPVGAGQTFAQIKANPTDPNAAQRLEKLMTQIRRATLRPLNFPHFYYNAGVSDLDDDGDPFDGAPAFSGSNPAAILTRPIDLTVPLPNIITQIEDLAKWLINGPWDVDNDGDGLPDSVWVDLGLPTVTAPDGLVLKPMIAPLIEDWDGRINVNYAGSYNQLVNRRFDTGPGSYTTDAEYFAVNQALDSFGRGGGLGPAEIDFSQLFALERLPLRSGFLGPIRTNQVGAPISIDQVLLTRYGNLLNVRYGGQPYNYASPYPYSAPNTPLANYLRFPGAGTRFQPQVFTVTPNPAADLLSRIPFPGRALNHQANSVAGRPVDMAGIMKTRKDPRTGTQTFNQLAAGDEIGNQPYEFGATEIRGDDQPFTPAELVDFQNGGELNGRLSQLLRDAANRNEALRRLLVTDSRSVDSPELPGEDGIVQFLADKLGTGVASNEQIHRMLALELRKGSKLNLNRQIGNEQDDTGEGIGDESSEIDTFLAIRSSTPTVVREANLANNRFSQENAFPQIADAFANQASQRAHYGPNSVYRPSATVPADFDGLDTDGDGILDQGDLRLDLDNDATTPSVRVKMADGAELLARHLYCLMFALIENKGTGNVLVPDFPYPGDIANASDDIKNRFVARRLAQWAVNAVDYRDVDSKCTRLRYDWNPFDSNGFDLTIAARNTVWGMERPEIQITETFATHDKRLKRNLIKTPAGGAGSGSQVTADGEYPQDDDTSDPTIDSDSDMDQFRMPQASAFVELQSLAPKIVGSGETQPSLPGDLYTNNALDLGRIVGAGTRRSPVWRLAIGESAGSNPDKGAANKSTRWTFDADRLRDLSNAGIDSPSYLDMDGNPASDDWTPNAQDANVTTWEEFQRHTADIRPSIRFDTPPAGDRKEYVTLSDDDLNPFTDTAAGNLARVELKRFVWFTNLPPVDLACVSDDRSGMRPDNVFNRKNAVNPYLAPGQYAVVAPRIETYFGQDKGPDPSSMTYQPSFQVLRLRGATTGSRLDYYTLSNDSTPTNANLNPNSPSYSDDVAADGYYEVDDILPLVCQSLFPHQARNTGDAPYAPGSNRAAWQQYYTNFNVAEHVDMGFNISAPLPNENFYIPPTHRIANGAQTTPSGAAPTPYPLVDGYHDYDQEPEPPAGNPPFVIDPLTGSHPDEPLDHRATAPLNINEWWGVGTHQEAATVFVQRLADPTSPWHPIDNPYITVDFMPMDLTTFNGEYDVRERVDRMQGGAVVTDDSVDDKSDWDDTNANQFYPLVRFDTRRKIPDLEKDRGATVFLPINNAPTTLADYERVVVAKRSPLSMTTSILRPTAISVAESTNPNGACWPYDLGAMWQDNGNLTTDATGLRTDYDAERYTGVQFDAQPFCQTLGFVNREYGYPVQSTSPRILADNFGSARFYVGSPNDVLLTTVPWMNREYQSSYGLANVPAVSRTSLLETFGPGTLRHAANQEFERAEPFRHLLGFDVKYSEQRTADTTGRQNLGIIEDAPDEFEDAPEDFTGDRAGFEQIFDYVDVGPVWFDSKRWFDPLKTRFRRDIEFDSGSQVQLYRMFNRAVETLQPPYNYIGLNRTPGKINVNTSPDYIRKGRGFIDPDASNTNPRVVGHEFLDAGEDPANPDQLPAAAVRNEIYSDPYNQQTDGNGFTSAFLNSKLYANGSVYRSFAWGISTPYELDTTYGSPATMGENNLFQQTVDSGFGISFKGFIEARRGFSTTTRGDAFINGTTFYGNPDLDWRYPTRFAGVFGPARAAATPTVQRMMRQPGDPTNVNDPGMPRRTHDMMLMRPHPDFDERTMTAAQRNAVTTGAAEPNNFALDVEAATNGGSVTLPALAPGNPDIVQLEMPLVNSALFERPQAELHKNLRDLDRDAYFRNQNTARLDGVTTHHSNVFQIRLTLGYFVVDPTTGAVGREYVNETGESIRHRANYVVDRTIPVGFLRGKDMGAERMILYSEVEE
ncbi:hypothetical protein [Stieleria mannarensis]|uniref:hypothetical protein n=1 Tax=Stieleria mannarensis TaxID=2755585 RepID=UPI0016021496|nr:hypothetical protein [Rhodopirellula sp. JC639]